MKQVIIVALIVLAVHVSINEGAIFTRLYYKNADCSGFHVAYNYMNSNDAPTSCVSGCTEWYSGQFWVKEVCGEKVSPLYNEGFAVVRVSPDETCSADYSETGAVAGMCIIWQTNPARSFIRRTCPGPNDQLVETGYSGAGCVLESSTSGYDRTCSYRSSDQRSYSVPQCPSVVTPPVAPVAAPVTPPVSPPVSPPVTPPVTPPLSPPVSPPVSAPLSAPATTPMEVPNASNQPSIETPVATTPIDPSAPSTSDQPSGSAPSGSSPTAPDQPAGSNPVGSSPSGSSAPSVSNQPSGSIVKTSSANFQLSLSIGVVAISAVVVSLL